MEYAIVDIETTGSRPGPNSVIEVAVVVTDGSRVLTSYQSLLHPNIEIPIFIRRLTGISDAMTDNAPEFAEVAEELLELLKDRVFVAHNVNFDYSFLRSEFESVGIEWRSPRMCTVKMARHFWPGLKKYNLGALCSYFGIRNEASHRAMGDSQATAELFILAFTEFGRSAMESFFKRQNKELNLPAGLPQGLVRELPVSTGVYYFRDRTGTVLYVGKATNIASRVRSHFNSRHESVRSQVFLREITSVDHELCGNILIASIIEDFEIKRLYPKYNLAQKERTVRFTITPYMDGKGIQRLAVVSAGGTGLTGPVFSSKGEAVQWLNRFALNKHVPPRQLGLPLLWTSASDDLPLSRSLHADFASAIADPPALIWKGRGRVEEETGWVIWQPCKHIRIAFSDHSTNVRDIGELAESARIFPCNSTNTSILESAFSQPTKWGVARVHVPAGPTR